MINDLNFRIFLFPYLFVAGRQAGQQSDEILINLKIFNSLLIALLGLQCLMKECFYHDVANASRSVFWGKVYCEACCGGAKVVVSWCCTDAPNMT